MYGFSFASSLGLTMSAWNTAGTMPSSTMSETSQTPNAAAGHHGWRRRAAL